MPKLETQTEQIYLISPDAKKTSLILYEEALSAALHLFLEAPIHDLVRKSEAGELNNLSEIILTSFRTNRKLPAETLFETALAQINQNLADLAHEGRRGWVGKFSCLIVLKCGDNILLANAGQTAAWLKRDQALLELLPAEKIGTHPLKTFQNFTQGKLLHDDGLILTTANIFNYVAFTLFQKIVLQQPLAAARSEVLKILQDSMGAEQSFGAFFLDVHKPLAEPVPEPMPETVIPVAYTPQPEKPVATTRRSLLAWRPDLSRFKLPALPFRVRLPRLSWRRIRWPHFQWTFFRKLSLAGKFFFVSFSVFLILFIVTISINGFKLRGKRAAELVQAQADKIAADINQAQSALIYKNNDQAIQYLAQAQTDYQTLQEMSEGAGAEFGPQLEQLANQVNKTSVAENPQTYAEFNHHPQFLAKTVTGFLLSGVDSNSLSTYDQSESDYFLLNSLTQPITAIAYYSPVGPAVAVADKIYRIDDTLKQYEPFVTLEGSQIDQLAAYNDKLYALDTKNGRVVRITKSGDNYTTQTAISGDYGQVRDLAIDGDFYLLSADQIIKISGGRQQPFTMPYMTDPISNATRIFAANNLYVLEPSKKRVIIMSKTGELINQISFPTLNTPLDFWVDEASRSMFLLDDNKMVRITF